MQMKTAKARGALLIYLLAAVMLGVYLFAEFGKGISMPPLTRLLLSLIIFGGAFCGSRLLACELEPERGRILLKFTFIFGFVLYIWMLISFVLLDSYFGRVGGDFIWRADPEYLTNYLQTSVNLYPFKTIVGFLQRFFGGQVTLYGVAVNLVGNVLAFLPFGFFATTITEKRPLPIVFALLMTAASSVIELAQLLTLAGSCDVDDVILNTLGGILAYLFFKSDAGIRFNNFLYNRKAIKQKGDIR